MPNACNQVTMYAYIYVQYVFVCMDACHKLSTTKTVVFLGLVFRINHYYNECV